MRARLIHTDQAAPVDVDTLVPHPSNARRGNVKLIAESLQALGQYRPVVVNAGTHTGRPHEILAGHHLVLAAKELGWAQVSALYVDVDDTVATKIMLADNRTSDVATYDDQALADLLESLPELTGTGFSLADLDQLLASLKTPPPTRVTPTPTTSRRSARTRCPSRATCGNSARTGCYAETPPTSRRCRP